MNATRLLTVTAVISVVLNLLLVGFIVGQRIPSHWPGAQMGREPPRASPATQMMRGRVMPPGQNDLNIFAAMRALDPETRKSLETTFERRMPDLRASLEQVMDKRRLTLETLAAQPADIERLGAALADLRQAGFAAQQTSHDVFLEVARSLPEDKRAAFLKAAGPRPPVRTRR